MSPVFNSMHATLLKATSGTNGDFCIRCHTQIGMQRDETGDFDHPRVPDHMPYLKHHVLYRLTANAWRSNG